MNILKKNLNLILQITAIVLVLGLYALNIYKEIFNEDETPQIIEESNLSDQAEETKYFIDIKGYVAKPGVYSVQKSAIINDVISLAGGFKKDAYTKNINLSKKVVNEMVIYVYSKNEYSSRLPKEKEESPINEKECICPEYNVEKCIENGSSQIIPIQKEVTNKDQTDVIKEEVIGKININNATIENFKSLPGIGDAKAKNIIEYRNVNGPFKDISEIVNVSGISEKIYNELKELICI